MPFNIGLSLPLTLLSCWAPWPEMCMAGTIGNPEASLSHPIILEEEEQLEILVSQRDPTFCGK